ncbi:hypothetical protein ER308_14735 [Egibacter rhizosphaerae]|uniref:Glycosyltransferase family 1 protein n=1 Tax=Egibacter rhizosphaerae TaxID=1670831 RepID=A0A411YHU1_9ACTN|nr:hypothetical protein [Egibacter rhizosphaerae]QBI20691.1 hypothetical protein ER308_14735 [Egibacter rhizosphaerae]
MRVAASAFDFKFFEPVDAALRDAGGVLRYDRWFGLAEHDPARSRSLARWADVLFAEWCLDNAVVAARERRDRQRLVVRFHRFEFDRDAPARLDADRVDLIAFAGPHFRDAAVERFGWPDERCLWVPNPVDVEAFTTGKTAAAGRTLGLLGWERQLKRLDRALDLLEALLEVDPGWRLRCKGQHPAAVDWVWHDTPQRRWFEAQLDRIASSDRLARAVRFDGFGPVADWLRDVGWILSPSDVESFHLAAAEGMASAAVPVIWERPGAQQVFPARWVHHDTEAAAAAVWRAADEDTRASQAREARAFVAERYDRPRLARVWQELVLGAAPAHPARTSEG